MPDALIYRMEPHAGGLLYVPDTLNDRIGPRARKPSKCLNRQSYGERLAKDFLISIYKTLKKYSNRSITLVAETVRVFSYLALPRSTQAKQLHHLHAHLSLGRAATGKKILVSRRTGFLR